MDRTNTLIAPTHGAQTAIAVEETPTATTYNLALGYLRAFITMLVVAHAAAGRRVQKTCCIGKIAPRRCPSPRDIGMEQSCEFRRMLLGGCWKPTDHSTTDS